MAWLLCSDPLPLDTSSQSVHDLYQVLESEV